MKNGYSGYLVEWLPDIYELADAGLTPRAISRELVARGQNCSSSGSYVVFAIEEHIDDMIPTIRYVLRLRTGWRAKAKRTHLILSETWTPEMQAAEFATEVRTS